MAKQPATTKQFPTIPFISNMAMRHGSGRRVKPTTALRYGPLRLETKQDQVARDLVLPHLRAKPHRVVKSAGRNHLAPGE